MRMVIDLRKVNDLVLSEGAESARESVHNLLQDISSQAHTIFSSIDIKSAFYAIEISEQSRDIFTVTDGFN